MNSNKIAAALQQIACGLTTLSEAFNHAEKPAEGTPMFPAMVSAPQPEASEPAPEKKRGRPKKEAVDQPPVEASPAPAPVSGLDVVDLDSIVVPPPREISDAEAYANFRAECTDLHTRVGAERFRKALHIMGAAKISEVPRPKYNEFLALVDQTQ